MVDWFELLPSFSEVDGILISFQLTGLHLNERQVLQVETTEKRGRIEFHSYIPLIQDVVVHDRTHMYGIQGGLASAKASL